MKVKKINKKFILTGKIIKKFEIFMYFKKK